MALDLATIGVTCGVYANYANSVTATSKVVDMEEYGVIINTPINIITQNTENGVILTLPENIKSIAAPGEQSDTEQNELIFTITGTPRVDLDLYCNTKITVINPSKWTIKNNLNEDFVYFPIRITLGDNEYTYKDIAITTEDKVYEYNTSEVLKAGVSYNETKAAKWEWDYENRDGDIAVYDSYDTKLGNSFDSIEDAPQFKIEMMLTMEWDTGNSDSDDNSPDTETPDAETSDTTPNTQSGSYLSGDISTDIPAETINEAETAPDMTLSGTVKTGDSFNFAFWISLLAASAVVIIVVIIVLLRKNSKATTQELD